MGLGDWMAKALKREKKPEAIDEEAAKGKAVAEELNKRLPMAVSGRAAVLKKREQMRKMDEMLEER
jgi:hypothetical protein